MSRRTTMAGEWKEEPEEKEARLAFEDSHPFRNGDSVIIISTKSNKDVFTGQVARVVRVTTQPTTGPCIRVNYGGVGINCWDPNEELCFCTKIGKLLYT